MIRVGAQKPAFDASQINGSQIAGDQNGAAYLVVLILESVEVKGVVKPEAGAGPIDEMNFAAKRPRRGTLTNP
jgi:hypothetical protein